MDAQERYEEIADDLTARNPEVTLGQMMGMPCIKADGKLIAGFWRGDMVFKLPHAETHARALAFEGAHLFDPGERNAPMKQWVVVPAAHADEWPRLAEDALTHRAG